MRSKLAEASRRALVESSRRLTREQRLDAFVAHCELMAALREAGRVARQASPAPERRRPR